MNFKSHLYASLLALFVITFALWRLGVGNPVTAYVLSHIVWYDIGLLPILFIGYSLMPDIDTNSTPENYFYGGIILVVLAFALTKRYLMALGVAILSLIPKLAGHRTFTHAWWFGVLVSLPLALFSPLYTLAAFGGFVVHKVCDW